LIHLPLIVKNYFFNLFEFSGGSAGLLDLKTGVGKIYSDRLCGFGLK